MKPTNLFDLLVQEQARQEGTINLIASENYASAAVLQATGSVLSNKYAEGYPGNRYYGGCQVVDCVENYARDRAKELFHAEHVNVQPHSGSSANMAVYLSLLKPGDTVVGMDLGAGGHLTHGHAINFSGQLYNFVGYGLSPETEQLDYDEIELLCNQHQPTLVLAGASAYSRSIDFKRIAKIARDNHAYFMADMAHVAGLVAVGLHQNPILYADVVTSTTHKTLRGPRGGLIGCTADLARKIDKAVMPGTQGGPLMHVIAGKAVAFYEALQPAFKAYQEQVIKNARAMAREFQHLGYRIVSGGTDNHLFLIDLRSKDIGLTKLTGILVEKTLEQCGIIVNRNLVPGDEASPLEASGIRLGVPAVTTRGFTEKEVCQVAHWIDEGIMHHNDGGKLGAIQREAGRLCRQFPIYDAMTSAGRLDQGF